jgi:hypothetical protein
MKKLMQVAAVAVIGAASWAVTAAPASADIVCNRDDPADCWHTHEHYDYQPSFGLRVHPDDWRWEDRDRDHYRWHEHEGRGYWRRGVWVTF